MTYFFSPYIPYDFYCSYFVPTLLLSDDKPSFKNAKYKSGLKLGYCILHPYYCILRLLLHSRNPIPKCKFAFWNGLSRMQWEVPDAILGVHEINALKLGSA